MILVVLACPLSAHAPPQLRLLSPQLSRHRAEVDFQNTHLLLRRDHYDVAVVAVFEFDQRKNVRRRMHRQSILERHLELQPKEKRRCAAAGKQRHTLGHGLELGGEVEIKATERVIKMLALRLLHYRL